MIVACCASCGPNDNPSSEFDPDANLDRSRMFFDDFDSGIDFNNWAISKSRWGTGNGGVIPENVNYTADGVVVMQANGDLYDGPFVGVNSANGKRTGAKIETRAPFGPGRYEVRMKAMPRFGATTAIWTYEYVDGLNQEIDIELNVENDFQVAWFTNWVTLDDKVSKPVNTGIVNNDWEWHTYKFEWHTNPNRVDYYIDDILFQTATSNIPTYASRFNIGVWFPDAWAGTPDFETDYMYVDWVKITPYLDNDYINTTEWIDASPAQYYPTNPIDYPIANLISNPGFEGLDSAWRRATTSNVEIVLSAGLNDSKAIMVPENDITYQFITGIDDSFELTLRTFVRHTGGEARILLEFYPLETTKISEISMNISNSDSDYMPDSFYFKELTFSLPQSAKRIELSLFSTSGNIYFDNLFLNLTKKTPPADGNPPVPPSRNVFFDNFNNGISSSNWQIASSIWGVNNGGVIHQNVNYLANGTVQLTANGDYYHGPKKGINQDHGRRTGAAIISNKSFGPGSFEVRAKIMPRFGATSAFWTFYNNNGLNNEIDIELNVNNDFKRVWFTNWLTVEEYASKKTSTPITNNDGNYHIYRFDWHTGENPRIEYYIDGVLYHTATTHIPNRAMAMWIGVWFPDGWAGTPNFETDYMYVDYFRHTAFEGEEFIATPDGTPSPNDFYPSSPASYSPANLIANADYDSLLGWTKTGTVTSADGVITIFNGSLAQTISGLSEGMILSFKANLTGEASVLISFFDNSSAEISDLTLSSSSLLTLPKGTRFIEISFIGNGTYRDVFLNLANRL